ncbi:MAG TPA: signal peptidase II [Streptosporangiaceae bacterium]|nr:signal peptidase II [Streptosporangiaceae bacterium]
MVIGVALFVLALDVVTKIVVARELAHHAPIRLLGGFLTLVLLRNSGAAFSIGTSATIVFTVIAAVVIVYILRTARKLRSLPWAITLGLLLGGATGNLGDRIFRSPGLFRGDVVDWIELPHWPVFNLADSAIVCGGVLAVLLAILGLRMDGTRETRGVEPESESEPEPGAEQEPEPQSHQQDPQPQQHQPQHPQPQPRPRPASEPKGTDDGGSALPAGA